ncbi:E3 ubiquitin ligase BIG BROTHER-related-like isoform X2 [Populus nigra]|uniref:E3 ubiquitin ligase BIG BROTHER-related-like isoform X2 n=1 Tax=Populus nigra TaxID=3691 RepID=UPI002B278F9B|nr:E3 ubiquitin ligase BIG BROTHER-related-like isoform X2 [Populus nigra]
MNSSTNNITQTPWYWYSEQDYDDTYAPNNYSRDYRRMPTFSHFRRSASQARPEPNGGGSQDTWRPAVEERAITVPLGLAGVARELPGPSRQRNWQASSSTQRDRSRSTQDEQNKALAQLKKETYNPIPKRMTTRLSLYYRDRALDAVKDRARETDDDGKRCAICLEDFEPKESVMVTPCNHMFHEECIVPWAKSNGKCPVCRFVLCDRAGGSAAPAQNIESFAGNGVFEGELISVMRAMEEAFIRGNTSRW